MPAEVAEMPTIVTSETVTGIAKKMCRELEQYPLHTQAVIVSILNMLTEHRQAGEKVMQAQKANEIGERQLRLAEAEAARQASRIMSLLRFRRIPHRGRTNPMRSGSGNASSEPGFFT